MPDRLPAGAAQGVGALAVLVGDGGQGVDGERRHRRQDHDGKHDGAGEDASAGAGRLAEDRAHGGVDHRQADEAVDDGGDADEQLDQGLEHLAAKAGADLHDEDGAAQGDGKREQGGEEHHAEGRDDERERPELAVRGHPARARDELAEVQAVDEKRREALLGDHHDEGHHDQGHKGDAGTREGEAHVLQPSLRQHAF